MSDIDLYKSSTDDYEELQNKRPDYVGARRALLDLVKFYCKDKDELIIADFCCGTGNNTKLLSHNFQIKKATLIDINKHFLDIATKSNIDVSEIVPIQSDILKVKLKAENDLVISMFAYHHVPNIDKSKYIEIIKTALKLGDLLILGEIYSPNKKTTLAYYKHLLDTIPTTTKTLELENFLNQTAQSDDFEYKVSRQFAHDQLNASGFKLIDNIKVWPSDNTFTPDVGTFVEVWKLIN